jgi:SET domain-containing protein
MHSTAIHQFLPDDALWSPSYLSVKESNIAGHGLFTTKACRAGEAMLVITGDLIDEHEALRRERAEHNGYIYWNDDNYIDAARTAHARYVNHSCQPNVTTAPRDHATRYLVATRDLAPDEELTMDYDYDGIYVVCQQHNPQCATVACAAKISARNR